MIEIKNVTKIYNGEKKAVDNISFIVNNGDKINSWYFKL